MGKTFKDAKRQYGTDRPIRQERTNRWSEIDVDHELWLSEGDFEEFRPDAEEFTRPSRKPLDKNDRNV